MKGLDQMFSPVTAAEARVPAPVPAVMVMAPEGKLSSKASWRTHHLRVVLSKSKSLPVSVPSVTTLPMSEVMAEI